MVLRTLQAKHFMKLEASSLFERLHALIHSCQKFIITTHVVPDGDGLGGEIALAAYLKALGKECHILNADPTPEKFSLVDPDREIREWHRGMKLPKADVILGVDVNEEKRVGKLIHSFKKLKAPIVFIDHHILEEPLKSQHIIDDEISSMGEFLYRYFVYEKAEITFKMALAMYVSITTDTKQFRHRKTTPLSHAIAAALVEIGVKPEEVHQHVHQRRSLEEMHLLGEALKRVRTSKNGKIAWVEISKGLQKKYHATPEETQSVVEYLMVLKNTEIVIVFREEETQKIKVSFRSKGNVKIYPLAKKLGGGGHAYEAGTLQIGSIKGVVKRVLKEVSKLI